MAAGAERKNPAAILVAAATGPFLDKGMFQLVVGRVPAVATGTGQSTTQMNVIDQVAQIKVRGAVRLRRSKGKKRLRFLDFGIGVTKDAIVLQNNLHLLRTQPQGQNGAQVIGPGDNFRFHRVAEERFEVVVQTVKVGPLLRCDSRFAILALGGQQSRQFLRNNKWLFVRRVGRCKKAYELAQNQDSRRRFGKRTPRR